MLGGGRNVGLLVTLVLGLLLISLFSPQYLSLDNALVVALQISFVGIASLGTASLIIGGNVDLSIGSQYALCAVSAAMLAEELPVPLAWIAGILLGATLGFDQWADGLAHQYLSHHYHAWNAHNLPGHCAANHQRIRSTGSAKIVFMVWQAKFLDIPLPIWILVAFALIAHLILHYTTQGRHLFAFGGNKQAAEAAGINGRRLVLASFALNGALVGISAVLAASRFGTAAPTFGNGFELDVIAAVILGGVAFTGGEGSITGVAAVILLGVINSGLISTVSIPITRRW